MSIAVYDRDRSDTEPHAVLTGDTLFIGDVGRPDLRASLGWSAVDLGGLLYDSLRDKLLTAARRAAWSIRRTAPGRCAARRSARRRSRPSASSGASNYALQPMTKSAFVDLVTADQPDAPAYFTYDAVLNSKERPTLDEALARGINPMTLEQVLALQCGRRADSRHARPGGIRRRAPGRQHQHRPRRTVRHLGRHRSRAASSRS